MYVLRGEKGERIEGSGSLEGRDGRVARALSLFSNRLMSLSFRVRECIPTLDSIFNID